MNFEEAARRYTSKPVYAMVDLDKKRQDRARAKSTSNMLGDDSHHVPTSKATKTKTVEVMKDTVNGTSTASKPTMTRRYSYEMVLPAASPVMEGKAAEADAIVPQDMLSAAAVVPEVALNGGEEKDNQVTHRAVKKANYTEISKEMLDSTINPAGLRYEDTTITSKNAEPKRSNMTLCQHVFGCIICVMAIAVMLILIVGICLGFVLSFDQILKLKEELEVGLKELNSSLDENREMLHQQNQQLLDTLESLGQSCNLAASCVGLLASSPSTPSGYYWVKPDNGSAVRVYCDMTRSCGGVTGGWTRVAELDTSSTTQCPGDLRYLDDTFTNNVSVCGINGTFRFGVCSPATFNLSGILYSRVCGRIKAYQLGTPEAFHPTQDIDSVYVDGISLTHGNPRQHIWTFAADSNTNSTNCPCSPSHQTTPTPSLDFVGEDYFCNTASDDSSLTYHFDNPVWDGDDCIPGNMCCSFNSPPWFYKQLPRPTTDDIEMRVCADQTRGDEDIVIESLEIYVQ